MDSILPLLHGFETALSAWNLFYCLLGVTIGNIKVKYTSLRIEA